MITIASFTFAESRILGEIFAQHLEDGGFPVERALSLASREIVEPALEQGAVDLVPEYAGAALEFLTRGKGDRPSSDTDATMGRLRDLFEDRGVTVLDPSDVQNRNTLVVTAATARRLDLQTVSDLREAAPDLVLGGPPECPERPLCLPGYERRYGLEFRDFVPLDVGGVATVGALEGGEIDVAVLFTTDAMLSDPSFVELIDDLGLQPAENIVPVVRSDIVDAYGDELVDRLEDVTRRLNLNDLRALNEAVEVEGRDPADVAEEWLDQFD
jgi:osmoprotectant transport system substrate-binding protein